MATNQMLAHGQMLTAQDAPERSSFFPPDMPVSYHADGAVASRYGDRSWDLSSMSTDGTSSRPLYFYEPESASQAERDAHIREQHKALMWLHMDAGKVRTSRTLLNTNLALGSWCASAAERQVDLYSLLSNPAWVAEDAQAMNVNYLNLTSAALKTLWRHRKQLSAPPALPLKALQKVLSDEIAGREQYQQTPLIPSRIYSAVLAALVDRMTVIEGELASLLGDYWQGPPGPRMTASARLAEHQVSLMLVVAAFSGMRVGEASILPREGVLAEFQNLGSTHFELRGSTHKLHKGVKHTTSWITSHQGARAVGLAQRIARALYLDHAVPPSSGQNALLFPSMTSPYKRMASVDMYRRLAALREVTCPVIEQADIEELDRLEMARGWERDDILVGKRWPLAFHQLRRSLAVYAHRSGMVSLPALKAQLQHITQEMTAYYAEGFGRAVNLVFDPTHFSHEWQAAKAESSYFAYALGVLFSDDAVLGQGAQRMANTIVQRTRQDTLRLFEEHKLAYRETPLGGCASTDVCKIEPLEPIPYHCLETNCVNLVVFQKRLDHVIKAQETAVATIVREDAGSVEHRLEARHLEVLLKARERLSKGFA